MAINDTPPLDPRIIDWHSDRASLIDRILSGASSVTFLSGFPIHVRSAAFPPTQFSIPTAESVGVVLNELPDGTLIVSAGDGTIAVDDYELTVSAITVSKLSELPDRFPRPFQFSAVPHSSTEEVFHAGQRFLSVMNKHRPSPRSVTPRSLQPPSPLELANDKFVDYLVERFALTTATRVLDLGCGEGWATHALERRLSKYGVKTVGMDFDRYLLAWCKHISHTSEFVTGSLQHLPFASGTFDFIFCRDLAPAQHIARWNDTQWQTCLAELYGALSDRGCIYWTHMSDLSGSIGVDGFYHIPARALYRAFSKQGTVLAFHALGHQAIVSCKREAAPNVTSDWLSKESLLRNACLCGLTTGKANYNANLRYLALSVANAIATLFAKGCDTLWITENPTLSILREQVARLGVRIRPFAPEHLPPELERLLLASTSDEHEPQFAICWVSTKTGSSNKDRLRDAALRGGVDFVDWGETASDQSGKDLYVSSVCQDKDKLYLDQVTNLADDNLDTNALRLGPWYTHPGCDIVTGADHDEFTFNLNGQADTCFAVARLAEPELCRGLRLVFTAHCTANTPNMARLLISIDDLPDVASPCAPGDLVEAALSVTIDVPPTASKVEAYVQTVGRCAATFRKVTIACEQSDFVSTPRRETSAAQATRHV